MKTSNVVFYVGEDSASPVAQPGQAGAGGKEAAAEWEAAIKAAVMPVVKTSSSTTASQEEQPAPPAASKEKPASASTAKTSEKEKEKEGRETEISQAYQIFPDEVLGSGQFGIVYGGVHR